MLDMNAAMRHLADRRPVFHSNADFQHALAMQIAQSARWGHARVGEAVDNGRLEGREL